jgi:hypothetical protein
MVSFDMTTLFPNVPLDVALTFLKKWLRLHLSNMNTVNAYLELAKLCMDQSYFQINGRFYKQKFGTSMVNALFRPIYSWPILMSNCENRRHFLAYGSDMLMIFFVSWTRTVPLEDCWPWWTKDITILNSHTNKRMRMCCVSWILRLNVWIIISNLTFSVNQRLFRDIISPVTHRMPKFPMNIKNQQEELN